MVEARQRKVRANVSRSSELVVDECQNNEEVSDEPNGKHDDHEDSALADYLRVQTVREPTQRGGGSIGRPSVARGTAAADDAASVAAFDDAFESPTARRFGLLCRPEKSRQCVLLARFTVVRGVSSLASPGSIDAASTA